MDISHFMSEVAPFHVSPIFESLYNTPDLVDLSASVPSSPPSNASSPQLGSSIFASATSIAAAAGRRAAAAATGATGSVASQIGSPGKQGHREQRIEIRCVEGYGNNLYVGRSDGIVEWWTCEAASSSKHQGWALQRQHTLFPRRPISRIVLLPKIQRLFVLSENTLHPLSLPNLDVIPSTVIQPLRGVVSVVLDDEELEWGGPGTENRNAEMTLVIVRRSGLGIYRIGQRLIPVKDIPLPSAPSAVALTARFLCAALPASGNYALIDLSDASLTEVLPISQVHAVEGSEPSPNIVVIPGETEFLVSSYTGAGSMGVFLNGQGDPVRGTLEWPDHPLSIAIDSGYIIALLRNQTIAIHSLNDLEKPAQAVLLDTSFSAFGLSYSPYGVAIRDIVRDTRMANGRLSLLGNESAKNSNSQPSSNTPTSPDEPPSGSGLTPPSSPKQMPAVPILSSSHSASRLPFSQVIAETLVVGPDGLMAMSPTPSILRLELLCKERRLEEAATIVDEERRKGRRGEIEGDKAAHQGTLRFLHLYLAWHLLLETSFEKAGDYFMKGKVDPRLLVRLYPAFRGKVIGSAEEVEILEGLRGILTDMPAIEKIIASSISRNYSPHVQPSTSEAPETRELRRALYDGAKSMLTDVLRRTRQSRRKGGGGRGIDSRKIDIVIDTTLAKLLADAGTTNELLALLAATNDVVLTELEPFLEQRPYILATVMRQQGRHEKVLELLKGIAEAGGDPACPDPVEEIAQEMDNINDGELFRQYILWLALRAPDRALSLLVAQKEVKLDDVTLLDELRTVDVQLANRYLEHAVVIGKSATRSLHETLLTNILDEIAQEISDEGVRYHLEELDADYRLSEESRPFVIFLADIAPQTPIKMMRLRLILFLQGSPFYDLANAEIRIEKMNFLRTELAIVLGRRGQNRRALHLLAQDIGDFASAQAYCTQGGEIVPPKIAHLVASYVPEVAGWATLGDIGRRRRGTVDAKVQEGLIMDLLNVYMQKGAAMAKQGAALLNAQAVHLDLLDMLRLIPNDWPLDVVSTFIQRGLRRELHSQASWQILKAISAGQNMAMSDDYFEQLASIPPTVCTEPSPSSLPDLPDEGSIAEKESGHLPSEKASVSPDVEKERSTGFFSPDIINKELRDIHRAEGDLR